MNRLYLVRHAENHANITKEFSHRLVDYSLTPKGVLQAQQTAEYFAGLDIHEIYTSPLKRAVETAEIIAARLGLAVTVMENFREVNVGVLEGQPVSAENWTYYMGIFDSWFAGRPDVRFPGGEDYFMLWGRIREGIEQIVAGKTGRNLVVIGHGGVFTVALKDLCRGIDVDWLRRSENPNCSITEVAVDRVDGALRAELVRWAYFSHLHGAAADLIPGLPTGDTFGGNGQDIWDRWAATRAPRK